MAENICKYCRETFTTTNGWPPDPPVCDDCLMRSIWGDPPPVESAKEEENEDDILNHFFGKDE